MKSSESRRGSPLDDTASRLAPLSLVGLRLICMILCLAYVVDDGLKAFLAGLTHHNSESGLAGKPCLLVKFKLLDHLVATFR